MAKSKTVTFVLLFFLSLSLVLFGLGIAGVAAKTPFLNKLDLTGDYGNIDVYATPSQDSFLFSFQNNNGLQASTSGIEFIGSTGVSVGVYTAGAPSTSVMVTVYDLNTGYSASETVTVNQGESLSVTLAATSQSSSSGGGSPAPTPAATPTSIALTVDGLNSENVAYGQTVTFEAVTSPAVYTGTLTLAASVNGEQVESWQIQLGSLGTAIQTVQPSSALPGSYLGDTVTWTATFGSVTSNPVTTNLASLVTPTPSNSAPTPTPTSTPISVTPPSTGANITSEVIGLIGTIVFAPASVAYRLKK